MLVVYSSNESILHRFRDITTFTVYVTSCALEKSFSFYKEVKITRDMCFSILV